MSAPVKIKTVPALRARTHLGEIMKEVQSGRVRVLVEKSGVPMVGIISAEGGLNPPGGGHNPSGREHLALRNGNPGAIRGTQGSRARPTAWPAELPKR